MFGVSVLRGLNTSLIHCCSRINASNRLHCGRLLDSLVSVYVTVDQRLLNIANLKKNGALQISKASVHHYAMAFTLVRHKSSGYSP